MPTSLEIVKKRFPAVTKVIDADKSVVISVIKSDSKEKGRKTHDACALANACKRSGADGALISLSSAYIVYGKIAKHYRIPQYAQREIVAYDRKGVFWPGQYKLGAIFPSQRGPERRALKAAAERARRAATGDQQKGNPNPGALQRRFVDPHVTPGIRTRLLEAFDRRTSKAGSK